MAGKHAQAKGTRGGRVDPSTGVQMASAALALRKTAERMEYVYEHTAGLGNLGIRLIINEVQRLENAGGARRLRRGYHVDGTPRPEKEGSLILFGLANYLYVGERHEVVVPLAFRLLRCADVVASDLQRLFRTNIGRSVCCRDHYGRVDVALAELEAGGLSADGSLEACATLLIAEGLLRDEGAVPVVEPASGDWSHGALQKRDTESLLRVRGRIIARLADLAGSDDWGGGASSIALGYIGRRDLDETLVAETHALVAQHLASLARLDTYDGCFDVAVFLWCCERAGIDTKALVVDLSPTPAQELVLALTRAICDELGNELSSIGRDAFSASMTVTDVGCALEVAQALSLEDWGEFIELVMGYDTQIRREDPGHVGGRVALSHQMIGELGSRLLEEREGDTDVLNAVLALVFCTKPSREYMNGTPIVAYIHDTYGRETGRRQLASFLKEDEFWWLERYDDHVATHGLRREAATALEDRRRLYDFEAVCAGHRLFGGGFAVEYLSNVCDQIERTRKREYPSIPRDVEEFRRMTDGVFDDGSRETLARLLVDLVGAHGRPSDEVMAEVLRTCPRALERILSVGGRRLSGDAFAPIAIAAYGEDEALEIVNAQIRETHRDDPYAKRYANGIERAMRARRHGQPDPDDR